MGLSVPEVSVGSSSGSRPVGRGEVLIADLIGGGSHPRPGEVSLAHNGVLFVDELPESKKNVLEITGIA